MIDQKRLEKYAELAIVKGVNLQSDTDDQRKH